MYFHFFRYLNEKNYPVSIAKHDGFCSSRQVLEGNARIARMGGEGKVLNRAGSLSEVEENILSGSGQLDCNSSRFFIQAVWWNNCLPFYMRGKEEHHSLKIELSPRN